MRKISIIAAALLLGACGQPQPYGYDPVAEQMRQANSAAWGRWAMDRYNPPVGYSYAAPVAPVASGPRCYHVTATGRCLHWGP